MSNSAALSEMHRWIKMVNDLPQMAERAAPSIAEELQSQLTGNFAAQRGPDGVPWQAAEDGRAMFQGAAGALKTTAKGKVIEAILTGRNLFRHHAGIARGKIKRPMLPTKDLPEPVSAAIKAVLETEFSKSTGGKG